MQLILSLLQAVLGVFFLMLVWIGVQAYIRRRAGIGPEYDVLEDMTHGCGNCHNSETCSGEVSEKLHGCAAPRKTGELIPIASGLKKG